MLRRLLFILVLCGIIFIVWRLVDPSGADNFLDGVKAFPDRWNSKDVAVDAEPIAERGTTTLDIQPITESIVYPVVGNDEIDADQVSTGETDGGFFDSLFGDEEEVIEDVDLVETGNIIDEEENLLANEDVGEKEVPLEGDFGSQVSEPNTQQNPDVSSQVSTPTAVSSTADGCHAAGEIAMSALDPNKCCRGLYYIYHRGVKSSEGVICFDRKLGVPSCRFAGTNDEGWYYPSGKLLRVDADCGLYFGDSSSSNAGGSSTVNDILENLVK